LRGTLALADAKQGIAMIEDEHGSERAYRPIRLHFRAAIRGIGKHLCE